MMLSPVSLGGSNPAAAQALAHEPTHQPGKVTVPDLKVEVSASADERAASSQSLLGQMVSNLSQMRHDMLKALAQNLRA